MNRLFLVIVSLLLATLFQSTVVAQDKFKFGKISDEELTMTQYALDTSAVAVCLYKEADLRFTYNINIGEFGTETEYVQRVKILKSEGKQYADVTIPFYESNSTKGIKEQIYNIKATSYTLVDGKVKESDLSKKYIFEEKGTGNWHIMKFSIPNVEVGTVIEYKYTRKSNNPYQLDPWIIQGGIPVKYAKCFVQIPEYFRYKFETKGYEHIHSQKGFATQSLGAGSNGPINVSCITRNFVAQDVPAVKDEPFLWCINDYLSCVEFELDGIDLPNTLFQSYTSNWEEVKKNLREYDGFGGMLDLNNPYQEDMRSMQLSELSFEDKLRDVFGLLKKKIKWNGQYNLYGKDIKETIKQGNGSNANMNFILMAMLRDADIQTKPILLRTRQEGRLPFRATLDKLNTFVVAAYAPDGTPYYLDGSIEYGDVNILPSSLMVSKAIVFDDAEPCLFVDLSNVGRTSTSYNVNITIQSDGIFEGTRQAVYTGQSAANFKRKMKNEKDSISTMQKTEEEYGISISECMTHLTDQLGYRCNEQISFSGELLTNGDQIYLNPMVFPDETETPFTKASRKFPVEFPYAQTVNVNTILTLPEGYVVEELPASARGTMNHNELSYSYIIRQDGNKVTLQYKANINTPFIAPEQYEELRNFWEDMVNRNNQQIVLKKAPEEL